MYMIAEVLQYVAVASFAEAWIEISENISYTSPSATSPPSRRRGLKLKWKQPIIFWAKSCRRLTASFAEAWIEILSWKQVTTARRTSPPSRRRGLKFWISVHSDAFLRRLLRGGVDWNDVGNVCKNCLLGRLLRGGVDWNPVLPLWYRSLTVASFAEAWIEIFVRLWDSQAPMSPPSRRRGLKCQN